MICSVDLETGEASIVYWSLILILTLFLDIITILGVTNSDKDLEILILRQQVRILQRKVKTPPRISDPERMILAIMSNKLSQSTKDAHQQLNQVMLIFKPDTVLCWHRELVRRKWIFRRKGTPGRPKVTSELEALIVRLAKKTLAGGTTRSRENCSSLATGCATSVRNILKRHRIIPASDRSSGSWRSFLGHYKDQILVCDFFKVETIWLKTIYVLFFIELGTRRIHMTGLHDEPRSNLGYTAGASIGLGTKG